MDSRLSTSLQESILTLICMDDQKGSIAASLIDLELFDPPYDDIATRAVEYRKRFKKAPGEAHLDDLFDHVLSNPKHKKQKLYQMMLGSIVETAPKLNPEYTLSRLDEFMRRQRFQNAVLEAAERMSRGGEGDLPEAENIVHQALKFRPDGLGMGMYLSNPKGIEYLTQYAAPDYKLGIDALDKRGVGLTKGETLGFMARKGAGKTWACVHVGVAALMQGAKVLHVSLEMKDQRVIPRYLRKLFAISKKDKYRRTMLDLDELGRVAGFDSKLIRPRLSLRDPKIEKLVAERMRRLGLRLDRLHFKSFPTSTMTMGMLNAYMDNLEATDGFVPDGLILDYPKLTKLRRNVDLRIGLGERMEELRGFCDERSLWGFFPFQTSRLGEEQEVVTSAIIGEDYSLSQTVDNMLTYSQTAAEKALNLARLYADKARSEEDGFTILITQDYESGQFCRESAFMPSNYWRLIKEDQDEEEENDSSTGSRETVERRSRVIRKPSRRR